MYTQQPVHRTGKADHEAAHWHLLGGQGLFPMVDKPFTVFSAVTDPILNAVTTKKSRIIVPSLLPNRILETTEEGLFIYIIISELHY